MQVSEKMRHYLLTIVAWSRAPIGIFLILSAGLQFLAAFGAGLLKPEVLGVPDIIPAANTTILALLWWRITQLEEYRKKMEERDEEKQKRKR